MSEEEVPAGPPAWPGGAGSNDPWGGTGWTSAPPPTPGWWPQTFYTYEPPPPPRRTSRLLMFGVAVGDLRLRRERGCDGGDRHPRFRRLGKHGRRPGGGG